MLKKFIVTIEVDEKNIADKYPNYSINFRSPKEFIDHLMNSFTIEGGIDTSVEGLERWGYSKKYKKKKGK